MFNNFKERFCVRGHLKQGRVEYNEPYSTLVGCSTGIYLLCLSMKELRKSRKVNFMNAFAVKELSKNVYITLPPIYGHEKPR